MTDDHVLARTLADAADPLLPDLLVCRPELRDPLLDALKRIA